MPNFIDITGKKYGRLTVLSHNGHIGEVIAWDCKCDCGNSLRVIGKALKNGNTKSCGCLASETVIRRNESNATHGMTGSPTYISWDSMKQRCTNANHKSFAHYSDFKICDRWLNSFENFLEDMGIRPRGMTLDRIDTNGNYEPDNCRWSTATEQGQNRNSNRVITYKGKTQVCIQWSRDFGIPDKTFLYRLKKGWSMEDALNVEVKYSNCKKNYGESVC